MSPSRWVRPSTPVTSQVGRFDDSDSERLSSNRVRKLLGEVAQNMSDTQVEELTNGLCAFADFAVTVFAEQRKQQQTAVSEQPIPPAVEALAYPVSGRL